VPPTGIKSEIQGNVTTFSDIQYSEPFEYVGEPHLRLLCDHKLSSGSLVNALNLRTGAVYGFDPTTRVHRIRQTQSAIFERLD